MTEKKTEYFNLKGSEYLILETRIPCYHCKKETRATALMLPKTFLELDDESETWETREGRFIMSSVEAVSPNVELHLAMVNPFFRMDVDDSNPKPTMLNYCEYCGGEIDENYLFGPQNFLFPLDDEPFEKGLLRHVVAPFAANARYVLTEDLWEHGRTVEISQR